MESNSTQKTIYNILAVVILVLALCAISLISYVASTKSKALEGVVTDLSANKYEIAKIDEAIQLLYKAENNSRLYVLNKNGALYIDYMSQLERASALIDSIQKGNEKLVDGLVLDKRIKTELYISAKLIADSLMKNGPIMSNTQIMNAASPNRAVSKEARVEPAASKVVEEFIVEVKPKKKLLGRIRDAIANAPSEVQHRKVTSIEPNSKLQTGSEKLVIEQTALTSNLRNTNASIFDQLSKKEQDLLMANKVLFEELISILVRLKQGELGIQSRRQEQLSDNAASLMSDLNVNSLYHLGLSFMLTLVVLIVLVLLYRNMQSLHHAKLRAEEYAKHKNEFIATLSHEIRTPLHSIHAFTDELSKKIRKDEGESEMLDAIKLSSNMLISVVNNILDFTKMETGKFKLNHAPFVPGDVISEVIKGLAIQANRKGLDLITQVNSSTSDKIYGDAFHFRQMLINIINNAIKYTEKGSITVSSEFIILDEFTGTLKFAVSDTGIGISEDRLPYVFDEYDSQSGQLDVKEGSTGLGLNIVKKIVDHYNGRIDIDSREGKGTSLEISINYDRFIDNSASRETNPPVKSQRHILIAENDLLNMKILKSLFINENYQVSLAEDGLQALEILKGNPIDIVITDIGMPRMSGYEFANEVRKLEDTSKALIPIIAMSGYEMPEDFQKIGMLGFNAWLVKPFGINDLLEKVEEAMQDFTLPLK